MNKPPPTHSRPRAPRRASMASSSWWRRKLALLGLATATLLGSSQAYALCSITDPAQPGSRPSFNFSMASTVVLNQADIRAGSVIYRGPPISGGMTGGTGGYSMNMTVSCNTASGTNPAAYLGISGPAYAQAVTGIGGSSDIFAIPGTPLGFRVRTDSTTLKQFGIAADNNRVSFASGSSQRLIPSGINASTYIEILAVKDLTDPAWQQPISIPSGVLGHITDLVVSDAGHHFYDIRIPNAMTFTLVGCETADITVNMGTHPISDLSGLHATSRATPFQIPLKNCPPGLNRISYRLQPTTPYAQALSAVLLDESSDADGVGVQVLYDNGTPHPLDQNVPLNQSVAAGGDFDIPLQARFITIDPGQLKPGHATTSMLFTIIYE